MKQIPLSFLVTLNAADGGGAPQDPCKALGGCVSGIDKYNGGDTTNNIFDFILSISNFLTYIAVGLAVLFLILGAFRMITSNGDDAQYKKGVQTLTWAIGGLVLAIIAYSIVYLVSTIVGNLKI